MVRVGRLQRRHARIWAKRCARCVARGRRLLPSPLPLLMPPHLHPPHTHTHTPPSPSHHQYDDICPQGVWAKGAASTSPIGAGMTGEWIAFDGPDPKTPSACAGNGWVSVKGSWNRCRSHVQIGHGCPAWGTTSATPGYRSHVCCMDVVRMSRSAATPPPLPAADSHTLPNTHTYHAPLRTSITASRTVVPVHA